MFLKTRKSITDLEKLEAVLEYLKQEEKRWKLAASLAGKENPSERHTHRLRYLEEQIALTSAYIAVEKINPHPK